MKRILITGVNSYVGRNVTTWLESHPEKYGIYLLSLKRDNWRQFDFSKYDVVFHVAGIAHVSSDPKLEDLYYKINRDLTIEVAEKARLEGVSQFIFMSSIIVYGSNNPTITINTEPEPNDFYGNSKLQAEKGIKPLENDNFKVAIIRPPMIYGKGSKGNYIKLSKFSKMMPVFPNYLNKRSVLHIDNLCEFIRAIIDNEATGTFFPQNAEYMSTRDMVLEISKVHGKKIKCIGFLNPLINRNLKKIKILNKLFGDLVYEHGMSQYKFVYQIRDFKESIKLTEL